MTDIAYEPHPVSADRKAELRAQGKRIIDIRFMPEGAKASGSKEDCQIEKTLALPSRDEITIMGRKDCIEWLTAHGGSTKGSTAKLRERLTSVMFLEG